MRKRISVKMAGKWLIWVLSLLALVHMLVLLGVMPDDIVWGGQIAGSPSMYIYEGIALLLNVLFILILSFRTGLLKTRHFKRTIRFGTWIIFSYFVLNALANLASDGSAERLIFAPLTALMALLVFRAAIEK